MCLAVGGRCLRSLAFWGGGCSLSVVRGSLGVRVLVCPFRVAPSLGPVVLWLGGLPVASSFGGPGGLPLVVCPVWLPRAGPFRWVLVGCLRAGPLCPRSVRSAR